jgi:hypothetical protein
MYLLLFTPPENPHKVLSLSVSSYHVNEPCPKIDETLSDLAIYSAHLHLDKLTQTMEVTVQNIQLVLEVFLQLLSSLLERVFFILAFLALVLLLRLVCAWVCSSRLGQILHSPLFLGNHLIEGRSELLFDEIGMTHQVDSVIAIYEMFGVDTSELTGSGVWVNGCEVGSSVTAVPGGQVIDMRLDGVHPGHYVLMDWASA